MKMIAVVMVNVRMECVNVSNSSLDSFVTLPAVKRIATCEVCVSQKNVSVKVTSMGMLANTDDVSMIALVMVTVTRVHVRVLRVGKE